MSYQDDLAAARLVIKGGIPNLEEMFMPRLRKGALLLLVPALLVLSACTTPSFRDDVLVGHPLCGIAAVDPCQNIRLITFRLFANSDVFSGSIVATQEYLEGMMPSRIESIFSQDTTFRMVGLPFTMGGSSSNFAPGEVVVAIMYLANPEEVVEPMINLVISSETTLAVRQVVCDGASGAGDLCVDELQELMEFYFTLTFS